MGIWDGDSERIRGTSPGVEAAARELRRKRNMTQVEQVLWQALQRRQLDGLEFRAQHPVGPFVLDFYCPACRLAIALDGPIHDGQMEQERHEPRT